MKTPLVLLGAGDHARDVLAIAADCAAAGGFDYELLGCLVDAQYGVAGTVIDGLPILGEPSWLADHAGRVHAFCAVGASSLRLRFSRLCDRYGVRAATIVHPTAYIGPDVVLGEGVMVAARCVLTRRVTVGAHTQINVGCVLTHGNRLAELVTLSPGVLLAGNVTVDTGCFMGIGASVIQGRRIGAWSTVGAGCTVICDVPANATVVGVPGRTIETKTAGWQEIAPVDW